ncbi:MAG: DUF4276 family protein [Acidobacteria bacterium]|nr:DUF4276 family protein [Acidobacteriota bacterium]MBI3662248.1 DUF4276 family protein [Acidobacteriota bacterium]
MPRFGFVVEGASDEKAVKEIARKCFGVRCDIETRSWAERGGLNRRFDISLEEFRDLNIDKAFVVRDSDGKDPVQLKRNMEAKISGRPQYPFSVSFEFAIQELEAWFLADHDAISRAIGRPVERIADQIEELTSPKDDLQAILSRARITYTPEVARKIANAIDPEVVARRCPAFGDLCQAIADC